MGNTATYSRNGLQANIIQNMLVEALARNSQQAQKLSPWVITPVTLCKVAQVWVRAKVAEAAVRRSLTQRRIMRGKGCALWKATYTEGIWSLLMLECVSSERRYAWAYVGTMEWREAAKLGLTYNITSRTTLKARILTSLLTPPRGKAVT